MGGRPDLVLINPGNRAAVYGQVGGLSGIAPPLGIGLIAAHARSRGHSVMVLDAQAEDLSPRDVARAVQRVEPVLAGVAAFTPQMTAAAEIVAEIRAAAPAVRTIMGGHHPAALPERTLRETMADFVCNSEGFFPVAELLTVLKEDRTAAEVDIPGICYRKGEEVVQNRRAQLVQDLDELPFVAWDLLPMERYRAHNWHCFGYTSRSPYAVVFSSLGCPFACSYCSVNAVYGKRSYRTRSADHFLAEIDLLYKQYGVRHMEVVDDTFTLQKDRVHRICEGLIERGYGLNLWAYARTDTVDLELLMKMKEAGFNWICYGFESGSSEVRRGVGKEQTHIPEAVRLTRQAGISILANFLFGLPDDDIETMNETLVLAKDMCPEYYNFYSVMAYPGSELYDMAVSKGWRLPDCWHGYSQYAYETLPLQTKHVSGEEVLRFRDRAFTEAFTASGYLAMVRDRFGPKAEESVRRMTERKLARRHLPEGPGQGREP